MGGPKRRGVEKLCHWPEPGVGTENRWQVGVDGTKYKANQSLLTLCGVNTRGDVTFFLVVCQNSDVCRVRYNKTEIVLREPL